MLVLPIVNRGRIICVQIRLKNAKKVKINVRYKEAEGSELIVNREKFSDSLFHKSRALTAPIEFIRSKTINFPRSFLGTTKERRDSTRYDIYEFPLPPTRVNEALDSLYGSVILDYLNEIPDSPAKGKYVSLEDLGIGAYLTDEKIAKLKRIVTEEKNPTHWPELFRKEGIADLQDIIQFFEIFECILLSDHSIPETSLRDTLKSMGVINTRDYRNLKKYYSIAKSNREIYFKISYVNKLLYDKPLTLLIHHNEEIDRFQFIKKKEKSEDYQQAA